VIYIHDERESPKGKTHESEEVTMTRFEKDYHEMLKGVGRYILENRMEEIKKLKKEQLPIPGHLPDPQPAGTGIRGS
jgi:hypothetical protein